MTRLPQVVVAATITVAPIATLAETETDSLPLEGSTEVLSFTTDEGSWLSIDVTPEGDSLVFDLLGDLYRLPIEGGEAVRITSGLGYDSQPVISPDGERIFGVDQDLGSLEIGKLADMVILNSNPLDNIRNTVDIDRVLVNGRLYDGNTMDQEWPDRLPLPDFWWWDEADRRFFP